MRNAIKFLFQHITNTTHSVRRGHCSVLHFHSTRADVVDQLISLVGYGIRNRETMNERSRFTAPPTRHADDDGGVNGRLRIADVANSENAGDVQWADGDTFYSVGRKYRRTSILSSPRSTAVSVD